MRCDRGTESLSFRTGLAHCINYLGDLASEVADVLPLHEDNAGAVGQLFLNAAA